MLNACRRPAARPPAPQVNCSLAAEREAKKAAEKDRALVQIVLDAKQRLADAMREVRECGVHATGPACKHPAGRTPASPPKPVGRRAPAGGGGGCQGAGRGARHFGGDPGAADEADGGAGGRQLQAVGRGRPHPAAAALQHKPPRARSPTFRVRARATNPAPVLPPAQLNRSLASEREARAAVESEKRLVLIELEAKQARLGDMMQAAQVRTVPGLGAADWAQPAARVGRRPGGQPASLEGSPARPTAARCLCPQQQAS